MKFFITFALLALFAVAYAQSQPVEVEPERKVGPVVPQEQLAESDAVRDKRGVLLNGGLAYTAYSSPYVYSGNYYYPYAYAYRSYPYSIYGHYY